MSGEIISGQAKLSSVPTDPHHVIRRVDLESVLDFRQLFFDEFTGNPTLFSFAPVVKRADLLVHLEGGSSGYQSDLELDEASDGTVVTIHVLAPNTTNPELFIFDHSDTSSELVMVDFDGTGTDSVLLRFYRVEGVWIYYPVERFL